MLRAKHLMSSRLFKILVSLFVVIAVLISATVYTVWSATAPKFKVKAKISGSICEIYGTHPSREEGKWIVLLATIGAKSDSIDGDDIAYIDQIETGKNGSFMMRFQLMTSRVANLGKNKDVYIYLNSEDMSISDPIICDILPVTSTSPTSVADGSLRVGTDVYELNNKDLTEDNILTSIKNGGNELGIKIGTKWYDLLDDKCTSSDWLVTENALTTNEVNSMPWGKYYENGATSPVYFQ